MPRAPLHPCPSPGCRALVRGPGRCPEHRAEARRQTTARVGSSYSQGYDSAWRKVRDAYLERNPFCVGMVDDGQGGQRVCGEPATIADHKVAFRGRPELRLDPTNLQPLCHHCSGVKTNRAEGIFGRRPAGVRP